MSHAPALLPIQPRSVSHIPAFARLLVDFCHSSNHLCRMFWIINIRLKYSQIETDDCLFSKQIPASVSLYQACPKWLYALGTAQHYPGASGHKWTVWTISTFVDIVHCWNMKLSFTLIHNTIVYDYDIYLCDNQTANFSVFNTDSYLLARTGVPPLGKKLYPPLFQM